MNFESIKLKVSAYPVAAGSVLVAIVAAGLAYWNWDSETELLSIRDSKSSELQEIIFNENNAKNLARDIEKANVLHDKILGRALDFESTISAQAFFADFVQRAPVKSEGLPVQDTLPILVPDANPLAYCSYKVHVSSDFNSLLIFLHSFGAHAERSMMINRVQISDADLEKKGTGMLSADVAFRLWGRKGELTPVQSTPDKKVLSKALRVARLSAADKFIIPQHVNLAAATNPFGSTQTSSVKTAESDSVSGIEDALNRVKFSIVPFLGVDAVKIYGNSPKRVNSELEVNVDRQVVRVKIIAITKDSFTVQTSSGTKIKISLKQ